MEEGLEEKNTEKGSFWETVIKSVSPSYLVTTFIFSWILFHGDIILVLFFSEEKLVLQELGLLKYELVMELLPSNPLNWKDWISFFGPFILTIVYVWVFPRNLFLWAYQAKERCRNKKDRIREEERILSEQEIEEIKERTEKIKAERAEYQRVAAEARKKIKEDDPSVLWEEDFGDFIKLRYFFRFREVIDIVYKNSGYFRVNNQEDSVDLIAYCNSVGLVDTYGKNSDRIKFTEKGNFFIKRMEDVLNSELFILKAEYGTFPNKIIDVTNKVKQLVGKEGLFFKVSNEILGGTDPDQGVVKEIRINYVSKGGKKNGSWPENDDVNIRIT